MVAPGASSSAPEKSMMVLPRSRAISHLAFVARRIGGEEGEIDVLELLGANALDESHLVADGFEAAQRLIVIKQANIHCREIAVAQDLGNFFSHERGGADDGDAIESDAAKVGGRRQRFWKQESWSNRCLMRGRRCRGGLAAEDP